MYARKLARLNQKLDGKWDLVEANWKVEEAVFVVTIKRSRLLQGAVQSNPLSNPLSNQLSNKFESNESNESNESIENDENVRITIPYAAMAVADVRIDFELLMKTGFMVYLEVGMVGFTTPRNQMIEIPVHVEKTAEVAFVFQV